MEKITKSKIQPIQIRNIILGSGTPKICVPIVGQTKEEILLEARKILDLPVDIVEWRVDWYKHSKNQDEILEILSKLREILGQIPLLFTIRTSREGGEMEYSWEEYEKINVSAVRSGFVDLIDVEIFSQEETVRSIIEEVHRENKLVIASNHDFYKTPEKDEIVKRLLYMQDMGADILKIAVMPQCSQDVLTLLDATREMVEEKADKPVVTMSMGSLGVISRLAGETFGSAMTFGASEKASAPGQIGAMDLKKVLSCIHGES